MPADMILSFSHKKDKNMVYSLGVTIEHVQMNVHEKRSWYHVQFQHVQKKRSWLSESESQNFLSKENHSQFRNPGKLGDREWESIWESVPKLNIPVK